MGEDGKQEEQRRRSEEKRKEQRQQVVDGLNKIVGAVHDELTARGQAHEIAFYVVPDPRLGGPPPESVELQVRQRGKNAAESFSREELEDSHRVIDSASVQIKINRLVQVLIGRPEEPGLIDP